MTFPQTWLRSEDLEIILATKTTAFGIFKDAENSVERFGESALISQRSDNPEILLGFQKWCDSVGWAPQRIYLRQLVKGPNTGNIPRLLRGGEDEKPREIVQELGLSYEVDFSQSTSVGLFCDQRANRTFLRSLAPKRVLNLFSYTCAFSVLAAEAGASTINVDSSRAALTRGKRNFALNDISTDGHRFVDEDVAVYLRRLAKREETFDAVIVDPPTFGRAGSRGTFRLERDFGSLVEGVARIAGPGCAILLSTNFSFWNSRRIQKEAAVHLPGGTKFVQAPLAGSGEHLSSSATTWALLPESCGEFHLKDGFV